MSNNLPFLLCSQWGNGLAFFTGTGFANLGRRIIIVSLHILELPPISPILGTLILANFTSSVIEKTYLKILKLGPVFRVSNLLQIVFFTKIL